ncbi:MAG: peptidyl-prolyl cis-trans isomerase [Candidatus Omnitrophica bacterium]|nr:peptidyl-prolyl cis-trans isomerase [Candidatus Omnitrophota bacterium]
MRVFIFIVSLFIAVSLTGCDKIGLFQGKKAAVNISLGSEVKSGTVVAKVNNEVITQDDLDQDINVYNSSVPEDKPELKITTKEQKVNHLKNDLIRRTLLAQDAADKGLDRNEDVTRVLQKTRQELLLMVLVKQIAETTDVSSAEIEDYYNKYKDQLKDPEQREIREIVVGSEQDARDILIQLLQGADFASLAKEKSKSASAKNGGDLGYVKKGTKSVQFDAVAFADTLDVGRVSSVFKTPDGYCIIKLEAKKGGQQKSLTDMWEDIKKGLTFLKQQQKLDDLVGKLSSSARIEIYEGKIK